VRAGGRAHETQARRIWAWACSGSR
jgi:hypothetical protein